jgi:hypothetical protein
VSACPLRLWTRGWQARSGVQHGSARTVPWRSAPRALKEVLKDLCYIRVSQFLTCHRRASRHRENPCGLSLNHSKFLRVITQECRVLGRFVAGLTRRSYSPIHSSVSRSSSSNCCSE